jgi:hypothetical protein
LQRHFGIELAVVADLDFGEMCGAVFDKIREAKQEPATLRRA